MRKTRTPELESRLIYLAGQGGTIKSIARAAGVPINTMHSWLARDEDFARRFYMPLESARAEVRRKQLAKAVGGDLKAAKIVLGWPLIDDAKGAATPVSMDIAELIHGIPQDVIEHFAAERDRRDAEEEERIRAEVANMRSPGAAGGM